MHFLKLACRVGLFGLVLVATPSVNAAQAPGTGSATGQTSTANDPQTLARQALSRGQYARVIQLLQPIVDANPDDLSACYLIAISQHSLGNWRAAVPLMQRAAELPALAANAHYNLSCAHTLLGDLDAAIQDLDNARQAGYTNWPYLWCDDELLGLRGHARFAEFAGAEPEWDAPFEPAANVVFAWRGEQPASQFGWVAGDAGDVDGDGVHDVITSAPFLTLANASPASAPNPRVGRVYVYSGATGKELRRHTGVGPETLGMAVSGVGDLDGDGHADYTAAGPRTNDPNTPGSVQVWSGKTGVLLLQLSGEKAGDGFGRLVEGLDDVNGDGCPDLLIGSHQARGGAGQVTLHSGRDGAVLQTLVGENAGDNFGSAIASGGTGDARLLVVGAMNAGARQAGRVVVYKWDPEAGPISTGATGATGAFQEHFRAEAEASHFNYGQFFASVPGDMNGDGVVDVYAVDFTANNGAGEVRALSGVDGALLWKRDGGPSEGLGIGNAIAGDVNGDGCADLVVGAWTSPRLAPQGGACYLLSGKDGAVLKEWVCDVMNANMGFDSTTLPDVDGDGVRDFLFTAASTSIQGVGTGSVYLVSSRPLDPKGATSYGTGDAQR